MSMVNYDAFGNGRYDVSALSEVEPGIYLRPEAGQQYLGAAADYNHRTGRQCTSSEGYRPLGAPGDLARGNANTQWYWFEMYGSPRAAVPGTSNHGRAVAVDINDWSTYISSQSDLYDIFSEVMHAYGFDDDVSGEPWHWHYIGSPSRWADQSITPFDNRTPEQIEEEELMTAKEDIINSTKYYTDAAVADAVNKISAAIQTSIDRVLDAERRESRPRLYQINEPSNKLRHGLAAAIDIDEGYVRLFGNPEELQKAKDQQEVAPETPFPLSAADFDAKVAAANARAPKS